MLPLWAGMVPFGIAYALAAAEAGLSAFETQLMSLAVFAGAAQFSAAALFADGASGFSILLTAFALNIRHLLYGLTLSRRFVLSFRQRLLAAHLLTDEAFGVAYASGSSNPSFLFGSESSLFFVWNVSTLIGISLGDVLADPSQLGLDFIFPLAFLALLVPLLRGRVELEVAVVAGAVAWLCSRAWPVGPSVLMAGVVGSLLGAWLTRKAVLR